MSEVIDFKGLIRQSLFAPADAARLLLSLQLPRQWLWMALALMSVLNSIVYSIGIRLSAPTDPTAMAMIPPLFQSPLLFTIFLFGGLVITVFTLTWVGQSMGGKAQLSDILVVIAWMQVLRLLFQVAVTVMGILSAQLSAMFVLAGSFWGIYILTGFLNTAHDFGNWIKALGVMILAGIAMAIGLTMIMTVIGATIMGAV
ncbi:Yip1 family protein [uncultured Roseovarius sp.]|uniref:Yip1 family protein n=1 Tax=uncultured Roseovarius sp. TaxID=293344 RepID=UPI002610E413|nr:Yip1 family protein [uncultured Roseovarius sp.]